MDICLLLWKDVLNARIDFRLIIVYIFEKFNILKISLDAFFSHIYQFEEIVTFLSLEKCRFLLQ